MTKVHQHPLEKILASRIAIIDGTMGTTIRTYGMTETDIRGDRFKDSRKDLLNNGDLFSLTQPKMICDIHRRFLEGGGDIKENHRGTVPSKAGLENQRTVPAPMPRMGRPCGDRHRTPAFRRGRNRAAH